MSHMTNREAKRIALRNIIEAIESDLAMHAWTTHPDTSDCLSQGDIEKIELAAREFLDVMKRRASRLRSIQLESFI